MTTVHENVQEYYGEVLASSADLRTTACCSTEDMPKWLRTMIMSVAPAVRDRFYGCGSPIPGALEGATVVDLGCGTGRDVYVLAQLVGPTGKVIGIDMTPGQLQVARDHVEWHREKLGPIGEVEFREGRIEDLAAAGIEDESVDAIVSNCVLNLAPSKEPVFAEMFRVLKPGGEIFVSDVFADRRIPAHLADHPVLRGECLGGALYWEDFRRLMAANGALDVRVTATSPIAVEDDELEALCGHITFESVTFRAFKLPLEDRCEDFGQVATYRGTIANAPHAWALDDHHLFETGRPMLVCGNTADMLSATRYAPHFDVVGDKATHFGLFDCGPGTVVGNAAADVAAGGSCC